MTRLAWAEGTCCALFFAYLAWLPLPFGSASDGAQRWLIVPALLLCAAAITIRFLSPFSRRHSRATRLWLSGGLLLVAVIAFELLPLPSISLRAISPEAARIRLGADIIARLGGVSPATLHPLTLDPSDTLLQLLRVMAYLATFTTALLIVRGATRRLAFAIVLVTMAVFEAVYAVHELSLQRFAIWGWKNTLMFGRASGTFVNPNHFAHYTAIILPMSCFLAALAWHESSPSGLPFSRRLASLIEKRLLLFTCGTLGVLACGTAVLIAQSRGAVMAIIGGVALTSALTVSGRKRIAFRFLAIVVMTAFLALAALTFGRDGIARRVTRDQMLGIGGRQPPIRSALLLWARFPLAGSGANTFENVVSMVQEPGRVLYNHAHNDYAELAATMGAIGLVTALIPLIAGCVFFGRDLRRNNSRSWRGQAFRTAALASLGVALTHALVDFNFFIPANPSTLAAIVGVAAGASARRRRIEGSASDSVEGAAVHPGSDHLARGPSEAPPGQI
ncbi:MAG: O-antigen ligase family protein [Thermoanaerobaculia bacterium]